MFGTRPGVARAAGGERPPQVFASGMQAAFIAWRSSRMPMGCDLPPASHSLTRNILFPAHMIHAGPGGMLSAHGRRPDGTERMASRPPCPSRSALRSSTFAMHHGRAGKTRASGFSIKPARVHDSADGAVLGRRRIADGGAGARPSRLARPPPGPTLCDDVLEIDDATHPRTFVPTFQSCARGCGPEARDIAVAIMGLTVRALSGPITRSGTGRQASRGGPVPCAS